MAQGARVVPARVWAFESVLTPNPQMLNDDPIVKEQFLFVWEAVSACPDSESSG